MFMSLLGQRLWHFFDDVDDTIFMTPPGQSSGISVMMLKIRYKSLRPVSIRSTLSGVSGCRSQLFPCGCCLILSKVFFLPQLFSLSHTGRSSSAAGSRSHLWPILWPIVTKG